MAKGAMGAGGIAGIVIGSIIVVILVGTLVGLSVVYLDPEVYGLDQNTATKAVDTETVYEGGRFFIAPGHRFITYPRRVLSMDFSDTLADRDGNALSILLASSSNISSSASFTVEVSLQYKINPESIPEIFEAYGATGTVGTFEERVISIVRSALNEEARVNLTETDFYENRPRVRETLAAAASRVLSPRATVLFLEVNEIGVSSIIESQFITQQVQQQVQITTQRELAVTTIQSATTVIQSEADTQISILTSEATANAAFVRAEAEAGATQSIIEAEAIVLEKFRDTIGYSSEQLFQFLWTQQLQFNFTGDATQTLLLGLQGGLIVNTS